MDSKFQEGPVNLEIVTGNGGVQLKASVNQSLGGGQASGVLSAKASLEIDLGAAQALALAGAMLKAHFPTLGSAIDSVVTMGQAELAKV